MLDEYLKLGFLDGPEVHSTVKWFTLFINIFFYSLLQNGHNFLKLLNFTLTTGQAPYMNPATDFLDESIRFLALENAQAILLFFPVGFFNVVWPTFLPDDGFGFVDKFFLLLLVNPNPSSSLSERKQRRQVNQHIK